MHETRDGSRLTDSDEKLLPFLAEMHPTVRTNLAEVEQLRLFLSATLIYDGYQIVQIGDISGAPIFAAIRRGTFTSVNALIARIRAYVEHWNTDAKPFVWTATADKILAKVRWVETNVKTTRRNNSNNTNRITRH